MKTHSFSTLSMLLAPALLLSSFVFSDTSQVGGSNEAEPYKAVINTFAPVINEDNLGAATENIAWQKQLTAKDKDAVAQALYFRLVRAPLGLSLTAEGLLTWMPSLSDAGEHDVVVEVSDGQKSSEKILRLKVKDSNRLPVWQQADLPSAQENMAYSVKLSASDEDNQALTFSLKGELEGAKVEDAYLVWQPSFEQAGKHNFNVVVSDGIDSVTKAVSIDVSNTNRAPKFTSEIALMAMEGKAYQYKLRAFDADDDVLQFELIAAPEGLQLNGNILEMTPSFEQAGEYPVHVRVSDNVAGAALVDEQFYMLQVKNTNRAAVIEPLSVDVLKAAENVAWSAKLTMTDADDDALTVSLLNYPVGMTLQNETISWTPGFEDEGAHIIQLVANDSVENTLYSFTLDVANTNRLPTITSQPVLQAKEAEQYQYALRAKDLDRTALVFSVIKGPEGLQLDPSNNNVLTWLPAYQQSGEHAVTLAVADGESSVEQSFNIVVENTNRAPVFPEPLSSILEDNLYSYKAEAQDLDLEDKQSVTVSVVTMPEGMSFKKNTLSWKPDFKAAGTYPIELSATDGDLVTVQKFSLVVENNNRLPVISSQPKKKAHETLSYSYTIVASDADDESLTYSLLKSPKGMTLTDNRLDWLPAYEQGGEQAITVAVSDGIDTVQQNFMVMVNNANRAPNLENISDQVLTLGEKFQYQLLASDDDGNAITYKLVHGPQGMEINKKGLLEYNPGTLTTEPQMIIVQVDDGELKKRRRFELTVIKTVEN